MTDEERAQRIAEVARKTIVLDVPGMSDVQVLREQPYGEGGSFDLYRANTEQPAPTVLFVYGFDNPMFARGLRQMGAYSSWGRLLASAGMNAVAYGYQDPVRDIAALITHLTSNAAELGIDRARLALWAASGNVPNALHVLMTQPPEAFRCAALLYGYMLDVPEATRQIGMVAPARGRSIEDLPRALPLLIVRAGNDQTPLLNPSLDAFVNAALARDLPLTLINQPAAPHSFDLFEDSEASRATIRRIVHFLREHLAT
jgi:hypothetical protein